MASRRNVLVFDWIKHLRTLSQIEKVTSKSIKNKN